MRRKSYEKSQEVKEITLDDGPALGTSLGSHNGITYGETEGTAMEPLSAFYHSVPY